MRLGAPSGTTGRRILGSALILVTLQLILLAGVCQAAGQDSVGPAAEKNVEKAISVRKTTQKDLDRWEAQKANLIVEYETLARQKKAREREHEDLSLTLDALHQDNRELTLQKRESVRIRTEMIPFLERVYGRLSTLVETDSPLFKRGA